MIRKLLLTKYIRGGSRQESPLSLQHLYPGFGGQKFIPDTLEKISEVRYLIDQTERDIRLQVDGGVNLETAGLLKESGADTLVTGTYAFKANDMPEAVKLLREIV